MRKGEKTYALNADVVGISVDGGEGSHFDGLLSGCLDRYVLLVLRESM